MRLEPLIELTKSRLLEFVRSPGVIFWVFGFPVLLAVALGLAFRNQPPEPVKVTILGDRAAEVAGRLQGFEGLEVVPMSLEESKAALRTGRIDVEVQLDAWQEEKPNPTYRYDKTRPEGRTGRMVIGDAMERAFGRVDDLAYTDKTVSEPGARYIDFLIPGLIGLNIMGSCMWGIGYAVVDSRRRKLLKRFAVTPMPRAHFLLSFMLSRLVFLIAEVAVLLLFGYVAFDVAIEGSVLLVGLLSIAGAFAFSGLSLLIAARSDSAEVASGWMNFTMLPMWLLSGSFFSYDRFPQVLHPIIQLLPLTALNDGLRGIINEGLSMWSLLPQIGVLIVWGLVGLSISLKIFKWQ